MTGEDMLASTQVAHTRALRELTAAVRELVQEIREIRKEMGDVVAP